MSDYNIYNGPIEQEIQEAVNIDKQIHVPRAFRRKEKKRTIEWNNKLQSLSIAFAMELLSTSGVWESEEVQGAFKQKDLIWRAMIRKGFVTYSYVANTKEDREKFLNAFENLCKRLCESHVERTSVQDPGDFNEVLGVRVEWSDILMKLKSLGFTTKARTWKGLISFIDKQTEEDKERIKASISG